MANLQSSGKPAGSPYIRTDCNITQYAFANAFIVAITASIFARFVNSKLHIVRNTLTKPEVK